MEACGKHNIVDAEPWSDDEWYGINIDWLVGKVYKSLWKTQ